MILIVESGATKADWCLCGGRPGDGEHFCRMFRTSGFNAATMDAESVCGIVDEMLAHFGTACADGVAEIHFYAAGLVASNPPRAVAEVFARRFPNAQNVEFASDLLAAARALFGDSAGVAAIMGTGSNSCLYDGSSVVRCFRSGGFILGDEGGGAALGRMFLADYFKELVPEPLAAEFREAFPDVDYESAVRYIYKGASPSAYLASFAPFVAANSGNAYAASLMERNVRSFIERSLVRYGCTHVGTAGSFGLVCRNLLETIGAEYGLEFTDFIKSPIDRLVCYHLK